MVVLTRSLSSEIVKNMLVAQDSNFFLVKSTNPRATYRVLWYKLPPCSSVLGSYAGQTKRECKVDILIPGPNLNIPFIPRKGIKYPNGTDLPVMPLVALLPLKLQAWRDHAISRRSDFQLKQWVDVDDIKELLKIVVDVDAKMWFGPRSKAWLPVELLRVAEVRVRLYAERYPSTSADWKKIGLLDH
ncbi:hypothetical protein SERLA73DRAFT_115020 [Serpula lacrymans var. lacrymans S7.3]|uniref:Uncharacterized protein n=1 Tax=Serpula lacrymans var. lacrymans (strain S7.3) TaxID=936435 RepID=F8QBY8_SERL3|nr:hypothetical protein SERLA73DRAFT_115020 [Serpula lacrymans var. lacrymans S7.3]